MKKFIKERLDILLEVAESRYSTKKDYYTTLFKVTKARKLYGGDAYWENVEAGDFVGSAIVNLHGQVQVRTSTAPAGDVKINRLGLVDEKPFYMVFQVRAGRGIEHPDTFKEPEYKAITRNGLGSEEEQGYTFELPQGISLEDGSTSIEVVLPKPGSPASDAQIKSYVIYGEQIISFVEKNLKTPIGYMDAKGAQISKEKMTPKQATHKEKKDLEKEVGRRITDAEWNAYLEKGIKASVKSVTSIGADKAAEIEKRQAELRAKYDALRAKGRIK